MSGNRSIGSFDLFTQAVSKPKPAAPAMSQQLEDTNKTSDFEHSITFSTCSYTSELGLKISTFSTDIISSITSKRLEDFKRVIFCGDFNSKPDSEVYELLNTGEVKYPYYGKLKIKNNFISSYYKLYENLMIFWEKSLGNRIYNLDYEILTLNQKTETRKLLQYIGLDWNEKCLYPQLKDIPAECF